MIRFGWLYTTRKQDTRLFEERVAVKMWLNQRNMFMADAYGFTTDRQYSGRKIMIRASDAREDFDAEAALFEFKMAWL